MIKVILIDDEPLARSLVKEYLQHFEGFEIVQECNDGFEGVKAITNHKPDLIILDIQMPKINGFEMLELLDTSPSVIFATAFDEYAIKAFEAHAVDYLLKPFSKERFDKAIQKWLESKRLENKGNYEFKDQIQFNREEKNRVVVKNGNKINIISVLDIHYLEAYDDYVKIYTGEGYHLKKKTMNHFEQILDTSNFLRVHRSFMVQLKQISKIEAVDKNTHVVLLKSGVEIPLSRPGYLKLKEVLGV